MRSKREGMETKEYRAPHDPEDSLEPTPEMLAKRRAAKDKERRDTAR